VLRHGGTMYIDHGNPLPSGIEESVRNLREVAPSLYFNVPRGFHTLLPYLQKDKALGSNSSAILVQFRRQRRHEPGGF